MVFLTSSARELNIFIQLLKEQLQHFPICQSDVVQWNRAILESLTVESERRFLTKLKPYFTGVTQYYSKI